MFMRICVGFADKVPYIGNLRPVLGIGREDLISNRKKLFRAK